MIPALGEFDSALGLLRDGYLFGSRRFERVRANSFRTRMLGVPVVMMRGASAARFFYEQGRFSRTAAVPPSVTHLLQDSRSVQTLEGADHRIRKDVFMRVVADSDAVATLVAAFERAWAESARGWVGAEVSLAEQAPRILARCVLDWCGIPATAETIETYGSDLLAMVDNAGRFGPANWWARARRWRTERWASEWIMRARTDPGRFTGTPLLAVATIPATDGGTVPVQVAAVELLNVLRPVVAVSRYLLFVVLGLRWRPDIAAGFLSGDDTRQAAFAHEVRRFFPFFPLIAGRATRDLEWQGHTLRRGSLAILDIYGTNRDPELWGDANSFRPERFTDGTGHPHWVIAQGGGDYGDDHRCPGEPATEAIISSAARILTRRMRYELPRQDLRISLRRFPALPESGVVLRVTEFN